MPRGRKRTNADEILSPSPRSRVPLPSAERMASASVNEKIAFDLYQKGKSIEEIAKTRILPEAELHRFLAENFNENFDLIKGPMAADMVIRLRQMAMGDQAGNVEAAKFLASAASNKLDPAIRREQVRAQLDIEGNILLQKLQLDIDSVSIGNEVVIKQIKEKGD